METLNINKSVVVETPKEIILQATVIQANKTTWAEIISADKISKFTEPEKEIVQIIAEVNHNGEIFKIEDNFNYFEKPMSNSKMGQYLNKYNEIKVGQTIKVMFNKDGHAKICFD
jgi:hypothetical protein